MTRRPELDALRGLMLVLMTVTHVPTRFGERLSQPFGFVSAAEGFVFLSAYLVGVIYGRRAAERGAGAMRRALWDRAGLVWTWHVAMLLFLFTVIAAIGIKTDSHAIKNLISFYLEHPATALVSGFALLYNPPLLDILPMYVLFMLASPLALTLGLRRGGWTLVLAVSVTLWVLAQFDLGRILYAALAATVEVRVPLHQTGAFELIGWQFLWIFGLWLGAAKQPAGDFPRWLVALALVIGIGGMAWRHAVGQAPFGAVASLNLLFDKWQLAPLRLINFLALLVIVMRFGPWLARAAQLRFLEVLGGAALPVFCTHLVAALLALAFFGDRRGEMPVSSELAVLAATFAALYAVAFVSAKIGTDDRAPERVAGGVEMKRVAAEQLRAR
jgi:hypothetical protein